MEKNPLFKRALLAGYRPPMDCLPMSEADKRETLALIAAKNETEIASLDSKIKKLTAQKKAVERSLAWAKEEMLALEHGRKDI